MARIRYGSLVQDISGSIGSATFQKSLYGNTLRLKPRSTKSATPAQLDARTRMATCQAAWQNISPELRRQWDQFIAFSGQSINRDRGILTTGHALFLKWNFARLQAGLSIVSDIVYKTAPLWSTITAIDRNVDTIFVTPSALPSSVDTFMTILFSPPRLESQSFHKNNLRFLLPTGEYIGWILYTNKYKPVFGIQPVADDILHVQYQSFSTVSPILSSVQSGIFKLTSI